MDTPSAYVPQDRRRALQYCIDLPDRAFGTVLFADLSGFTPLSEALDRELGPERGAEEVSSVLNRVFDALIACVETWRGSVITFAGDAMTCWFDHDDGRRVAACAFDLQHTMASLRVYETPGGQRRELGLKVTAVAGPVRRFVVGDPTIQLIDVLAGRTLDRLAHGESVAERGEVILDQPIVNAAADLVVVREWRRVSDTIDPFAMVLPGADYTPPINTHRHAQTAPLLSDDVVRPWVLTPIYERIQLGEGRFLADLRPVAVFFLGFSGLDFDDDPDAEAKLDTLIRQVQQRLAQTEGYLLQLMMGDKGSHLCGAVGAPRAHDDDALRAVDALVDIFALPTADLGVHSWHAGVTLGRVWAGAYGSMTRHVYGIHGDTVNLAARLMGKAQPGQIIVDQRVQHAISRQYDTDELPAATLKGKTEPVPIALVNRRLDTLPLISYALTPLIGRTAELNELRVWLDDARQGHGRLVRIEGAAGVGKSRLIEALCAAARDQHLHILPGACHSIDQHTPYAPWRAVLLRLLDVTPASGELHVAELERALRQRNPEWVLRLPLLGDLLGLDIRDNPTTADFDAKLRHEVLTALVVDLIEHESQHAPLLLVLEDTHWIDEGSATLVQAVARSITTLPVLLLITQRPIPPQQSMLLSGLDQLQSYRLLHLPELSEIDIATLVDSRLHGMPSPVALALIHSRAQGNPFYAEELLTALQERGLLVQTGPAQWDLNADTLHLLRVARCIIPAATGDGWEVLPEAPLATVDIGLPDTLYALVLSRLDRLPQPHLLTLKLASVIGDSFDRRTLTNAHPQRAERILPVLHDQMHVLAARGFVRVVTPHADTFAFRHAITREVVYGMLTRGQQRELHEAVAEVLEVWDPDAVEVLAHHYRHTDQRDKQAYYYDHAARKAQREYANDTALFYYDLALDLERRWQWQRGRIEVLHLMGEREREYQELEQLQTLPDVPPFQFAYLWGQYYEAISDYDNAQLVFSQALRESQERGDNLDEARCLERLGWIAWGQGAFSQALNHYGQAEELVAHVHTADTGSDILTIKVLIGKGNAYKDQGHYRLAWESYTQAHYRNDQLGNAAQQAHLLNVLGMLYDVQRETDRAIEHYERALKLRRQIGDRLGEGSCLLNLSLVSRERGLYKDALAHMEKALKLQQRNQQRWDEANTRNNLGILYLELGDLAQAHTHLLQALQITRDIGDATGEAYALANLGLLAYEAADSTTVVQHLTHALALAQQQGDRENEAGITSYFALLALQRCDYEEALKRGEDALSIHADLEIEDFIADDYATLAAAYLALRDLPQALDCAQQSCAILDAKGGSGPEFPQRDYFICYQVFAAAGQSERAHVALQNAARIVEQRASTIDDPSLRRSFCEGVAINKHILAESRRFVAHDVAGRCEIPSRVD